MASPPNKSNIMPTSYTHNSIRIKEVMNTMPDPSLNQSLDASHLNKQKSVGQQIEEADEMRLQRNS